MPEPLGLAPNLHGAIRHDIPRLSIAGSLSGLVLLKDTAPSQELISIGTLAPFPPILHGHYDPIKLIVAGEQLLYYLESLLPDFYMV